MAELDHMAPADDGDIRARLVQLEHRLNDFKPRLVSLENWRGEMRTEAAVQQERWGAIRSDVVEIKDNIKWLVRLVVGGIVLAILAFIASGGLNIPPAN